MKRIGVFGGCFDPPHIGHMIHGQMAFSFFELDSVIFIPAAAPPHKDAFASYEARARMTELSIEGNRDFSVSTVEKENNLSYTVETLSALKSNHPGCRFFLIIGSDEYEIFDTWRDPEKVMEMAELIVLPRRNGIAYDKKNRVYFPDFPLIEVSSSMVRTRLREGKNINYLVRDNVRDYITETNLYKEC
jgi:nicotinate-nucleotide adenylyltransferase